MDVPAPIDVVFPALDEAGALPWVLGRLPSGYRAIVVDNGSSDGTADVARAHGAMVVHEPRRGFGAACAAGLAAATSTVVCFCDADASLDPADLPAVTGPVVARRADLVLGARRPRAGHARHPRPAGPGAPGRTAWPVHARLANRALALELRRRTGVRLTDIGPLRAARRADLLALGLRDRRFGWPLEMVLRADRAGWRVTEVPVAYHPRIGRSKVTGTVRGTARAVRDMSRILHTT